MNVETFPTIGNSMTTMAIISSMISLYFLIFMRRMNRYALYQVIAAMVIKLYYLREVSFGWPESYGNWLFADTIDVFYSTKPGQIHT